MTRVSVVVPTLNNATTIEKCLASIRASNTRYKYEVIVVDGSSSDGTAEIARKYADTVLVEKTIYPGVNRNKAVRVATGDIICFTESDCIVPAGWIDELVNGLLRLNRGGPHGHRSWRRKPPLARWQPVLYGEGHILRNKIATGLLSSQKPGSVQRREAS